MMKAGKLDAALKEFSDAYAKNRKAINAERLGNIYLAKAEKDKKFFDNAINSTRSRPGCSTARKTTPSAAPPC